MAVLSEQKRLSEIWEVAIRHADHARKSKTQEGDIILVRRPLGFFGSSEQGEFIWLKMFGLPDKDMQELVAPIMTEDLIVEKRRYVVRFKELKKIISNMRLESIRDGSKKYQPLGIRPESPLFDVRGLVYDKQLMRVL